MVDLSIERALPRELAADFAKALHHCEGMARAYTMGGDAARAVEVLHGGRTLAVRLRHRDLFVEPDDIAYVEDHEFPFYMPRSAEVEIDDDCLIARFTLPPQVARRLGSLPAHVIAGGAL